MPNDITYTIIPAILIIVVCCVFFKNGISYKISFETEVIPLSVYESNEDTIAANAAIMPKNPIFMNLVWKNIVYAVSGSSNTTPFSARYMPMYVATKIIAKYIDAPTNKPNLPFRLFLQILLLY